MAVLGRRRPPADGCRGVSDRSDGFAGASGLPDFFGPRIRRLPVLPSPSPFVGAPVLFRFFAGFLSGTV